MKILALDLGDKWVGSAISDALGITCKPYKTVPLDQLDQFLASTLNTEDIGTVVVGNPQTLKGQESEQTHKVQALFAKLNESYSTVNHQSISWVLMDERLSSKRAQTVLGPKRLSKEDKLKEHSIAAAFILQNYLDSLRFNDSFLQ